MVGIINTHGVRSALRMLAPIALVATLQACVTTEALYAEYDAGDCNLVAVTEPSGEIKLIEQNTHRHFQWEPAVYFGFDSDQLTQYAIDRLDRSLVVLKQFPELKIGLQGFADRFGNAAYNFDLTERRVATVKRYLVQQGVAPENIISQPLGEGLPVNGRGTIVENRVNRRVELQLLSKTGRPAVQFVALEE